MGLGSLNRWGEGMVGKVWQIGEACRAVYSDTGGDYEGWVLFWRKSRKMSCS